MRPLLSSLLLVVFAIALTMPARAQQPPPAPPAWQDDIATPDAGSTRGLPAMTTGRANIDAAIQTKAWAYAEKLLAAEIERAPMSAEAPGLLKTLAGIFLLDRKPLNAAVAIKKAAALAPLDEPTRFALVIAYISMQHSDWARPELIGLAAAAPDNVIYEYWLARLDYDDGLYGSAIKRLERVIERDKTFTRAFDNLGLCYEAQNQPETALTYYREAVRLNRENRHPSPWPPLNLGILLHKRGALDEAESLLKESLGTRLGRDSDFYTQHDLARAYYELGTLLEQRRRAGEAVEQLSFAVKADPTYPEPHYVLSRIYRRANKPEQADESLATFKRLRAAPFLQRARAWQEQAAKDPAAAGKAIDTYRELLALDATNVEALYQSAFLLALQGKFGDSRALIDRLPPDARGRPQALAVLTVDLVGVGATRAEASSTATRLAQHPDLSEADILAILPAFAHAPSDAILQQLLQALDTRGLASAATRQQLADFYMRHDRAADARAVLERAASTTSSVQLLIDLARAAYKGGDPKGALGYLAHARDLDPGNAGVHFFFGMACVALNLGAEAYESLKKAVALDPKNPFINYAMGAVSVQRHDASESLPYFEAYVRLKPDDPRGRFALGAARFYSNQLEQARDDLRQVAGDRDTAAGAHYFLARIARQLNELETARRELDIALRFDQRFADAWAELGLVQTRNGQYAEAQASLDKALAIDPQNYAATFNLSTLYSKTKDPRREEQAARLTALQEQRTAQAQEFLRIIEVSPY